MKRLFALLAFLSFPMAGALAADADYHYQGRLDIDPASGRIDATWRIEVLDDEATSITFLLRKTLENIQVTGSDVTGFKLGEREGMETFTAIDVALVPSSGTRTIDIAYGGVLLPEPMENRINAIEPGRIELNVDSFWFPIDARFNRLLTTDLVVQVVGDGWRGVTTGDALPIEGGVRIVNDDPRLDIAFALSTRFHVTEAEGFTIYDLREDRRGADRLAATAAYCRDFLNGRFGAEAALPASRLLVTTREASGYARQNYVVFTEIADTGPDRLTRFVCHEFAHNWARGGRFDTVDNWINESFAEYLGMMAVRERLGNEAYDALVEAMQAQLDGQDLPPIWTPGASARGPYLVNYRKGPLALARLERRIGKERFLAFTQALFRHDEKSTPVLLDTLASVAGVDERAWFGAVLAE